MRPSGATCRESLESVERAMSSKRSKPDVRFRLRITKGETIAIGPGKTDLLEAIATTGSLTSAAKRSGCRIDAPGSSSTR